MNSNYSRSSAALTAAAAAHNQSAVPSQFVLAQPSPVPLTLGRLPRVLSDSGTKKSTFYAQLADGLWPKPVSTGKRTVAWILHETNAVIAARVRGLSEAEIRLLVRELEAARKLVIGCAA